MQDQIIIVKNAEGDPDTTARLVVQNQIDYTPKVSVIIPVYNTEEYLRECLDSVVNQTLKDIEIICVDDGSTDSSLDILKEYAEKDKRITIINQENNGVSTARNCGLNISNGEFIAFMDSDDLYPYKNTLEEMYDNAIDSDSLICGGSLCQIINNSFVYDASKFDKEYTFSKSEVMSYFDYQYDYGYWRFIYKRDFLSENNIKFDNLLRQQDPPFFIKAMYLAKKFYAMHTHTYAYRVSHKKIKWTERKAVDIFKGLKISLTITKEYGLEKLHCKIAQRLNAWTFQTAIATTIKFKSVRDSCLMCLDAINKEILEKNNINLKLDDIYHSVIQSRNNDIVVSVVVPVYNVSKYLKKCVDSVRRQTLPCIEIILVNDGSTDNSLEIIKDYAKIDSRIRIIDKKNGGLSSARNAGSKVSQGFFIYFIDSDDWIEDATLEKAISGMIQDVDIVCFGAEIIGEGIEQELCKRAQEYHVINIFGKHEVTQDIILKSTITVWNKLFKRYLLEKYEIVFAEGRIFEDNDFTPMYFMHCRSAYYINEYLYKYIKRPNSIMDKVLSRQTDKVIDSIYVADNLYIHCQKYELLERFFRVIRNRILFNLKQAYKNAPSHMKNIIRIESSKLAQKYDEQILQCKEIGFLKRKEFDRIKELRDLIISLTSWPGRIDTVHITIESLLAQTLPFDKVILWLAPEQFPNKENDLPAQLLELTSKGLTIEWYHDIKSYKKLIPTLKKYPDAIIVTADDDVVYPKEWLDRLYYSYISKPDCIHCGRARLFKIANKKPEPYHKWPLNSYKTESFYNFFTGVGGVVYKRNLLHKDIMDESKFMKICPNADDIWFWGMAVLNGTKICVLNPAYNKISEIPGTQVDGIALWKTNLLKNENDEKLKLFFTEYPQVFKKLMTESKIKRLKQKFDYHRNPWRIYKDDYSKIYFIFGFKFVFKKKDQNIKEIKIMGMQIYKRVHCKNKTRISILGIPLYSVKKEGYTTTRRILFFKYKKTNRIQFIQDKLWHNQQQVRKLANELAESRKEIAALRNEVKAASSKPRRFILTEVDDK